MNKITVIGTFHREGGACTSDELVKIIRKISPNVIFFEAPLEIFEAMLKATESFNAPEIRALRKIIEEQPIDIMPVDIHENPFDGRLEEMFELYKNMYREYFFAGEIQAREIFLKGFPYINSDDCDKIHKDKSSMEKIFVARANYQLLSQTYIDWLKWNDKREDHWVKVIHDYFKKNKISTALFLVGSAHRIRLMEKIKNLQSDDELIPEWDFYPYKHMNELKKLTDEQQAVIVHEAGHVAMAISLHLTPVEVKLGFDGVGLARVTPEFKGFSPSDNKRRIAVLKAGSLAERKYTDQNVADHGAKDRKRIKEILIEDGITDSDEQEIESNVIQFLNNSYLKVLKLAELIACNYQKGQYETLTAELEKVYNS